MRIEHIAMYVNNLETARDTEKFSPLLVRTDYCLHRFSFTEAIQVSIA